MDKNFSKEFTQCPACGSTERFFESLANELINRGLARKGWKFHLDSKRGVVIDQSKAQNIPIGSVLPGYEFATDICCECGCIYAIHLMRGSARKSIDMPKPRPPKLGLPLQSNDPRYS